MSSDEVMTFPVDQLALLISILALSVSMITLILTELRGPDITLVYKPELKVTDDSLSELEQRYEYLPTTFSLQSVTFLFANYGGKDGTVVNLKINFTPKSAFRFFESFQDNVIRYEPEIKKITLPLTVEKGSNRYLEFAPEIRTKDWKKNALAEVLDPKLTVKEIVNKAMERSKANFRDFCEYMETNDDFGTASCTAILTKGLFWTKTDEQKILDNLVVKNECNSSLGYLRRYLEKWEELRETRNDLENYLLGDIRQLFRELDDNVKKLIQGFNIYDFSIEAPEGKLRIDSFQRLEKTKDDDRKIRWFIIKSDENIEKDLGTIYRKTKEYNNIIDRLISKGETITENDIEKLNGEKEQLRDEVRETRNKLTRLLEISAKD